MKRQIRSRGGKGSKVVKFSAYRKESLAILNQIREYQDRYEYQLIKEYEDKFHNFQADGIQLGEVFPQLFDLGNRVVLVSVDFYKNRFCLDDVIKWLEKNNIVLGNKGADEVMIDDAHEMIEGLKFKNYPIVAYSRGIKRIRVSAAEFVEITEKFVCEPMKIDTGEAKDIQFGLTVIYNDEIVDGIPRINLDMSRDLVICNGAVIVTDYIDEYHGCLAFFRTDEELPVSFIFDTNTTIYIDSYDRDDTGALIYIIKYQYIVDLESLSKENSIEEVITTATDSTIIDDSARFGCINFGMNEIKTNGDGYEKVCIMDKEGRLGAIEYFEKEQEVIVQHPIPEVEKLVKKYLNNERSYLLPFGSSCIPLPAGSAKPTDNLGLFDIAVNEMYSRIGIHVRWGDPEPTVRSVVRTVPYNPKGREGVLIGDDGSVIYDDSWLHQDILDAEKNDGGDKK